MFEQEAKGDTKMSLQSDLESLADTEIDIRNYFDRSSYADCLFREKGGVCDKCPVDKLIKKIGDLIIEKCPEEKNKGIIEQLYKGRLEEKEAKYGTYRCASVIDWNNEVIHNKKLEAILQ
jgi:hypothetical protein